MDDVLKSGYYESPLGYDNVDWFVDEVIKLENRMAFYFKNTNKDFILSENDEEHYIHNNICRFCGKVNIDKVGYHCHSTGKCRGPANSNCIINITETK